MFRQLFAILWKNWLLKKTHALSTLAELVLPVGFMGLLILIKSITSVSDSPNIAYSCGQTYPWYFTEEAPEKIEACIEKPPSCDQRGYYRQKESFTNEWTGENFTFYEQLGYVDSSASAGITSNPMYTFTVGDKSSAYIYAEPWSWENPSLPMGQIMSALGGHNRIFGVAPLNADDADAVAWAGQLATYLRTFDDFYGNVVQYFDSSDAMDDYMTNKDYDDDDYAMGKIAMAVVINSVDAGATTWDYAIRTNYTDMFSTSQPSVACLYWGWDNSCGFTYTIPTTKYYVNDLYKPQQTEFMFGYSYSGFLSVQNTVDTFIFQQHSTDPELHTSVTFMPTSAYKTDDFQYIIASSLGLFYMLSYLYPVSRMVRALVLEKENRFKEGMKMMGLTDFAYNLSWAITLVLQMTVVAVLITLVTASSVFEYSNKFYVFLYFEVFSLAVINMCFLMATIFSKSKTASLLGPLIFFAVYFPYYAVSDPQFPTESKTSVCLLAPACFALGANVFADFEGGMVGIQSGNTDQMTSNFSYNLCIGMLAFDVVLYGFLAWYLDKIFPSEYGTQLPWYFPALPSYWCGFKLKDLAAFGGEEDPTVRAKLLDGDEGEDLEDGETGRESLSAKMKEGGVKYEPVSTRLKQLGREGRAVKLRGLRKVFKTTAEDRVAVNCLNLDMFEGQVTVLLGHNGAGKSTTISMMVGLIPPTAGDAFMFNQRLSEDMQAIRRQLGVCPQHDILFPELTVQQHLQMFAAFKGVPSSQVDVTVNKMIAEVGLNEKKYARSATLSGGQKRKLSLGIALIGDSKIIVLDEPTSGMDPYSRRSTWNIIQQNKKGRIILLTTHFMDEADTLGDRIAIMADGKLRCVGSSLFLKKQYGVGYTFTIVKDSKSLSVMPKPEQAAIAGQIKDVISTHVVTAELLSDVGAEVSFRLPFEASGRFVEMFRQLDRQKAVLHISQYGISVTTLEEVFLKVAEKTDEEIIARTSGKSVDLAAGVSRRSLTDLNASVVRAEAEGGAAVSAAATAGEAEGVAVGDGTSGNYAKLPSGETGAEEEEDKWHHRRTLEKSAAEGVSADEEYACIENDTPFVVFRKHFRALLLKRIIYGKRDRQMFCCQLILPVLLVVFGLGILLLIPNLSQPDLVLNAAHFNPSYAAADKNYVPIETLGGTVGGQVFDRFTGNSDPSMPGGGVWGKAVTVNSSMPDAFYGCVQGAQELMSMNNFLLGQPDGNKVDEKGSSRYGAYTVSAQSTPTNFSYNVMVNGSALHGAGIFVNLMDSALLQVMTGDNTASITVHNYPLPRTFNQVRMSATQSAITAAFFFMIAFSFIPASFATFIVKEREIKAKHQQIISGVSLYAYWCSSWVWDVLSYLCTYVLIIAVIFAYGIDAFTQKEAGLATAIVFLLYGPAIASFTYVMSFAFSSHSTAQILVMFFNFVTGLCLMIVAFILPAIPSAQHIAIPLRYVFRLFPSFCLGDSLAMLSFCDDGTDCPDVTKHGYNFDGTVSPLHWNITGGNIVFMCVQTVVYFMLAVLMEWVLTFPTIKVWLQHLTLPNTGRFDPSEPEDADVTEERRRVASGGATNDIIRLQELRKVYPLPKGAAKTGARGDQNYKVAVQSLSFAMPKGECFGFLGINGAGKTTTLSILSGEFPPTSGTAFIDGFDIKTDQSKIRRKIGYCPQFDALLELLTVREHLELYARIKGIRGDLLEKVVQNKLGQLNLHDFEHKAAGSLSGGNKRKLSVAIALIAEPSIVFLDEPSTGMDPMARRFMWDVIARVSTMDAKCSVVLTTHSMEEAEALCTRIGIMVNGRLRCLGSGQHLKNRFGSGYELDVKTRLPDAEALQTLGQYLVDRGAVRFTGFGGMRTSLRSNPMAEEGRGSESSAPEGDRVTAVSEAAAEAGMLDDDLLAIRIAPPLHSLCTALNKPQRAALIAPNADGQTLYDQMQVDGFVTLKVFLEWWVAEDYAAALQEFMRREFSQECMLLERASAHSFRFRIPIPVEKLPLADIFERIERSKEALCIKDYAVGQTTLEQIFNQFAASQDNPEVEAQQLHAEQARRRVQAEQQKGQLQLGGGGSSTSVA